MRSGRTAFNGGDREAEGIALGDLLGHGHQLGPAAGDLPAKPRLFQDLLVEVEDVLRHIERPA
jgi:hypothetical protein